jgi:hypothetical protein
MLFRLNGLGPVALGDEVAAPAVAFVERTRVDAIEPLHPRREVALRCRDDEVVVRSEHAVHVATPTELGDRTAEEAQEAASVVGVCGQPTAARRNRPDVIDGTLDLESRRICQAAERSDGSCARTMAGDVATDSIRRLDLPHVPLR